jgi:hypothetical protein
MQGDLPTAVAYAEECVAIAREVNDADGLVLALHTLGRLMVRIDDIPRAKAALGECLARARDLSYREALANCVQAAADLTVSGSGDLQMAARLQSIGRRALHEIGVRPQGLEGESFERTAQALESRLGGEQMRAIEDETASVTLELVLDDAQACLQSSAEG